MRAGLFHSDEQTDGRTDERTYVYCKMFFASNPVNGRNSCLSPICHTALWRWQSLYHVTSYSFNGLPFSLVAIEAFRWLPTLKWSMYEVQTYCSHGSVHLFLFCLCTNHRWKQKILPMNVTVIVRYLILSSFSIVSWYFIVYSEITSLNLTNLRIRSYF